MTRILPSALISLSLLALASAAPSQQNNRCRRSDGCSANMQHGAGAVGKAIYFLTNDAENAVVALPIHKDGTISKGTVTKTGGAGSTAVNAMMQPAAPDALVGQSALTVGGESLFAVNAGSNTLSMFSIDHSDPTCLRLVGQPAAIPGEFPNTVAVSVKHNLACVGTTGAVSGISCASFSASHGLGKMDTLRPFDIGQSTPPVGPTNTVSQVFFSGDDSLLFATVKGDPAVNNTGFLSAFSVEKARRGASKLSAQEVRSSPQGTAVLFGSAPIPNRRNMIFVTDASFGAAILSVDQSARGFVANKQEIEGQKATCWATISAATNSAFVTDVAVNRVVEMSVDDARIISQLDLSANGDPGLIDLRSAGNFVYALSPGNGTIDAAITVLDVSGGQGSQKMAQHFKLSGLAGKNSQGMAVFL